MVYTWFLEFPRGAESSISTSLGER